MSDDTLVARMRTCAAFLKSVMIEAKDIDGDVTFTARAPRDAIALLIEGADHIEREHLDRMQQLQKQPMKIIEPMPEPPAAQGLLPRLPPIPGSYWIGTDLPPVAPKPCPQCGSINHKSVGRRGGRFMLKCPECDHVWPLAGTQR